MTLQTLLNSLVVQGFRLTSDGANIELSGPLQRLTPELRQAIRDSKPELLRLLPVSYETAERYAIQNEATAPPEGDDWPEAFTWGRLREAVASGKPPEGWEFRPLVSASSDPYNERDASELTPRDASNSNLRTQFERILNKASVEPWPRLFQNLRASRETELANSFPLHVVTAWLGNTPSVADRHYLQVTQEHFAQAVAGGGARGGAAGCRNGLQHCAGVHQADSENAEKTAMSAVSSALSVPPQGLEP